MLDAPVAKWHSCATWRFVGRAEEGPTGKNVVQCWAYGAPGGGTNLFVLNRAGVDWKVQDVWWTAAGGVAGGQWLAGGQELGWWLVWRAGVAGV